MTESFLYYIWQFQYFNKENLQTKEGESITIFNTGFINTNAGPDFNQAKIKIGSIEWVGSVEIHRKAADWMLHKHSIDEAYNNVILHVVWEGDEPISRADGSLLPMLSLKGRVDENLLQRYGKLVNSASSIPCEKSLPSIDPIRKISMLDNALIQRLQAKAKSVDTLLEDTHGDWQEATYQLLAKNFGFKVNADPFLQLSKSIPYKLILKHQSNLLQLEALMFGQAGMLETKTKAPYGTALFQEYDFLSKKYSLQQTRMHPSQWKFLRMRPANFPTLRIAQFASLLHSVPNLFSRVMEANSYNKLLELFSIAPSHYWKTHYHFAKKSKGEVAGIGQSSKENMVINTIAPLWMAYGQAKDDQRFIDRSMEILQHLPAENNKITREWSVRGFTVKSAYDSQALIEQYTNFCKKRQCLNCEVGISLLKPK
jgi:hypothetical protein